MFKEEENKHAFKYLIALFNYQLFVPLNNQFLDLNLNRRLYVEISAFTSPSSVSRSNNMSDHTYFLAIFFNSGEIHHYEKGSCQRISSVYSTV